jgi:hypothetical protein
VLLDPWIVFGRERWLSLCDADPAAAERYAEALLENPRFCPLQRLQLLAERAAGWTAERLQRPRGDA